MEDRARASQLRGASLDGFLLRTPSSLAPRLSDSVASYSTGVGRFAVLLPAVGFTSNSGVPLSMNDGSLWAGLGPSVSVTMGLRYEKGPLRIALSPQLVYEANQNFALFDTVRFYLPYSIPPYRSPFSPRWNISPNSIDAPLRFGTERQLLGDAGESSASLTIGAIRFGAATEHEWWGPGIDNALLLSNNAPGVPRVFVRSSRPLASPVGALEFAWFLGRLDESPFFRTPVADTIVGAATRLGTRRRSLAAAAVVWRPKGEPTLAFGLARAVYAPLIYRGPLAVRALDVFANTGQPDDRPLSDSSAVLGRDQLLSLFGRWVLPADGFEAYFEWIRATMPVSLRDFLTDPGHSRGYTIGLQWLGSPNARGGALRIRGEATNLEQDPSYRYRPLGSIYTSRVVPQGYTQRGQTIGAAIGQGASSQSLAVDYLAPKWSGGVFAGRIRWNEDAHALTPFPAYKGWCEHDVSVYGGARGSWISSRAVIGASFNIGIRDNLFYQNPGGCPLTGGQVDVRNLSLRFTVEPLSLSRSRASVLTIRSTNRN